VLCLKVQKKFHSIEMDERCLGKLSYIQKIDQCLVVYAGFAFYINIEKPTAITGGVLPTV
jgi:hypothetical protein